MPRCPAYPPAITGPIGIFDRDRRPDSGSCHIRWRPTSHIYFGDNARVPYGPKSPDTVRRTVESCLASGPGVKAVVIASTPARRTRWSAAGRVPVPSSSDEHGAGPLLRDAWGLSGSLHGRHHCEQSVRTCLQAAKPGAAVEQKACPLFVPLVEEGWFEHPAAELIALEYLQPLKRANVDVMVLGCTHYPLLKPLLQRTMGPDIRLIDSGEETAATVQGALHSSGLNAPPNATPAHRFVVSDDEARFRQVGSRFIGERLRKAEVVPLG